MICKNCGNDMGYGIYLTDKFDTCSEECRYISPQEYINSDDDILKTCYKCHYCGYSEPINKQINLKGSD